MICQIFLVEGTISVMILYNEYRKNKLSPIFYFTRILPLLDKGWDKFYESLESVEIKK